MMSIPKKIFIIIIHTNTTHILDISCCHKHQQQKYHNESTKKRMFMHFMFVDMCPLTKAIPIMFEYVATHYQTLTLQTWIDHDAIWYHNFNASPHALLFISS